MKTVKFWIGLFVVSSTICNLASALDESLPGFPARTIGLPALSLADAARENLPSIFQPFPSTSTGSARQTAPAPKMNGDKFVIKPDESVNYKLIIKRPDASADYRLIIKNPEAEQKK